MKKGIKKAALGINSLLIMALVMSSVPVLPATTATAQTTSTTATAQLVLTTTASLTTSTTAAPQTTATTVAPPTTSTSTSAQTTAATPTTQTTLTTAAPPTTSTIAVPQTTPTTTSSQTTSTAAPAQTTSTAAPAQTSTTTNTTQSSTDETENLISLISDNLTGLTSEEQKVDAQEIVKKLVEEIENPPGPRTLDDIPKELPLYNDLAGLSPGLQENALAKIQKLFPYRALSLPAELRVDPAGNLFKPLPGECGMVSSTVQEQDTTEKVDSAQTTTIAAASVSSTAALDSTISFAQELPSSPVSVSAPLNEARPAVLTMDNLPTSLPLGAELAVLTASQQQKALACLNENRPDLAAIHVLADGSLIYRYSDSMGGADVTCGTERLPWNNNLNWIAPPGGDPQVPGDTGACIDDLSDVELTAVLTEYLIQFITLKKDVYKLHKYGQPGDFHFQVAENLLVNLATLIFDIMAMEADPDYLCNTPKICWGWLDSDTFGEYQHGGAPYPDLIILNQTYRGKYSNEYLASAILHEFYHMSVLRNNGYTATISREGASLLMQLVFYYRTGCNTPTTNRDELRMRAWAQKVHEMFVAGDAVGAWAWLIDKYMNSGNSNLIEALELLAHDWFNGDHGTYQQMIIDNLLATSAKPYPCPSEGKRPEDPGNPGDPSSPAQLPPPPFPDDPDLGGEALAEALKQALGITALESLTGVSLAEAAAILAGGVLAGYSIYRVADWLLKNWPSLTLSSTTLVEGDKATITVTLSKPPILNMNMDWATRDGSAKAGVDYVADNNILAFQKGSQNLTQTFEIQSIDDLIGESNKFFWVDCSYRGASGPTCVRVETRDNDPYPQVVILPTAANEGQDLVVTGRLVNAGAPTTARVDLFVSGTTEDGTATLADNDYTKTSFTLNFPAGKTEATFHVPTTADLKLENDETIYVRMTHRSDGCWVDRANPGASMTIRQYPRLAMIAQPTNANEGATVAFSVTTAGVTNGTRLAYTLGGAGITTYDIAGGKTNGVVEINQDYGNFSCTLNEDWKTEGPEILSATVYISPTIYTNATATINDTSREPTITLATKTNQVNEGDTVIFGVTTAGVKPGLLPYTLLGIDTNDVAGGKLDGFVAITAVGKNNGYGTFTCAFRNDGELEGPEKMFITVTADGTQTLSGQPLAGQGQLTINDTSHDPLIAVTPLPYFANEGDVVSYSVEALGIPAGSVMEYRFFADPGVGPRDAISTNDFVDGKTNGTFVVNNFHGGAFSTQLKEDYMTEGPETLVADVTYTRNGSVFHGYTCVQVADTSRAVFKVVPDTNAVVEGESIGFTIETDGLAPGALVYYTLSGVGTNDIQGDLSGAEPVQITQGINGRVRVERLVYEDNVKENDILTLAVTNEHGVSASVNVLDTTYVITPNKPSVYEYEGVTFNITVANGKPGKILCYEIITNQQFTLQDLAPGTLLAGHPILGTNSQATLAFDFNEDLLPEGDEVMNLRFLNDQGKILTIRGVLVKDSSNKTYTVTAPKLLVKEGEPAAFNINTTAVRDGTKVAYLIKGAVDAADFNFPPAPDLPLSGTVTINNSLGVVSRGASLDHKTEPFETMTLALVGTNASASLQIQDVSHNMQAIQPPPYGMCATILWNYQANCNGGGFAAYITNNFYYLCQPVYAGYGPLQVVPGQQIDRNVMDRVLMYVLDEITYEEQYQIVNAPNINPLGVNKQTAATAHSGYDIHRNLLFNEVDNGRPLLQIMWATLAHQNNNNAIRIYGVRAGAWAYLNSQLYGLLLNGQYSCQNSPPAYAWDTDWPGFALGCLFNMWVQTKHLNQSLTEQELQVLGNFYELCMYSHSSTTQSGILLPGLWSYNAAGCYAWPNPVYYHKDLMPGFWPMVVAFKQNLEVGNLRACWQIAESKDPLSLMPGYPRAIDSRIDYILSRPPQ